MPTNKTNNSNNVSYGKPSKIGAIYTAPVGSVLPTNATSDLDTAFECIGYISSDGLKATDNVSSDKVNAWGGDPVLYTKGEHEDTYTYTMIESSNPVVLKEVYGYGNVTTGADGSITVRSNSDRGEERAYVMNLLLKNGGMKRIVIPRGCVTEVGEVSYTDTDPIGYETTLSALPYEDYEGDTHREFIKPGEGATTYKRTGGN